MFLVCTEGFKIEKEGLTLTGPGGGLILAPPGMIIDLYCDEFIYELETSSVFQLSSKLAPEKYFFPYLSTGLRKLTVNDKIQEIFSIEKRPKTLFQN
jgi:hypothetical protein